MSKQAEIIEIDVDETADSTDGEESRPKVTKSHSTTELKKLAGSRVAKDFFTKFYHSPSTDKTSKDGRVVVTHKAVCKFCRKDKTVLGQDGYNNFRSHILSKHYKENVSNRYTDY